MEKKTRLRESKYSKYYDKEKQCNITFAEYKERFKKGDKNVVEFKNFYNRKLEEKGKAKEVISYVFDFETTVKQKDDLEYIMSEDNYKMQEKSEVWSAACCKMSATHPDEVQVYHSIKDFYDFLNSLEKANYEFWAHNAGFDFTFIVDYFMITLGKVYAHDSKLDNNNFKMTMTSSGLFYNLTFKNDNDATIKILDSYKLCNQRLEKLGNDLKTKHQKLEMEYAGKMYPGCEITDEQMAYIKNDCLVLAEALTKLRDAGVSANTAASTCLHSFKEMLEKEYIESIKNYSEEEKIKEKQKVQAFCKANKCTKKDYAFRKLFPRQDLIELDIIKYGNKKISDLLSKTVKYELENIQYVNKEGKSKTYTKKKKVEVKFSVNDYIRESYKGGFTWANPHFTNKTMGSGRVLDACSLYPSQMHSKSGNIYPYGNPIHISKLDNKSPEQFYSENGLSLSNTVYFLRVAFSFNIKKDKLPCIQIKSNTLFNSREWLTSSNDEVVVLTLTNVDWELIKENYKIENITYHDIIVYNAKKGIFDKFIDHWIKIKDESSPGLPTANPTMRYISKIQMNGLYGKLGSSPFLKSKYPVIGVDVERDIHGRILRDENGKQITKGYKINYVDGEYEYSEHSVVYLPAATFATAYSRRHTITLAQRFYSSDITKDRLLYIDTDSIHYLDENVESNTDYCGLPVGVGLCTWKEEARFDKCKYLRSKTYMERLIYENSKKLSEPFIDVKVAGLPDIGKEKFLNREDVYYRDEKGNIQEYENIEDIDIFDLFAPGLVIKDSKLGRKIIEGGTILHTMDFSIKK